MNGSIDEAFEDGTLILRQIEVPGHPGFSMFAVAKGGCNESMEREYREGYYLAVSSLFAATNKHAKFNQGYQHALVDIWRMMKDRGRLSTSDIKDWVSGCGLEWLDKVRTDLQVLPPELRHKD